MSSGIELIVSDSEVCLIFTAYYQKKGKKREGIIFPWMLGTGLSTFDLWSHLSLMQHSVAGVINPIFIAKEIEAQRYWVTCPKWHRVVFTEIEPMAVWLESSYSFRYIKLLLESEGSSQPELENFVMFKRRIKGRIMKC